MDALVPTSNFERLLGVVSLVAAIGAGYSAITINHFDAQMASLRASIENATARFEGQASRIDAAFTGIGDIKANTAETKVAVDYLKGDVAEMKAKVTNIQEDMQRVKGKLHADADPLPFPALVEYKESLLVLARGALPSMSIRRPNKFPGTSPTLASADRRQLTSTAA